MKDFECACGRKQSYAPATKRGGVTEKEAEWIGWRKINGEWNCPFCTGNKNNLKRIFNKGEALYWQNYGK